MTDAFGQGAFDPDAAGALLPSGDTLQSPEKINNTPAPPQPGPTFRAPLGPTEQRDPFAQPAWPEIADAAFKKSNTIASTLSFLSARSPDATLDPNWNPLSLIKGSEFENQPELFIGDLNKEQTAARMAQMRDEKARGDILAKSGSAGIAMGLAAGVLDPINYLPIFGEYAAATRFGQVAYDAARLASFGAVTAAGSEAVMHATQETRTWSESAGNIASATLLMGMLGGTLGMLAPAERAAAAAELDGMRPKVGVDPATGEATFHAPEAPHGEVVPFPQRADMPATEPGITEAPIARAVGAAPSDIRDLDLKNFGLNQLGRLSEATIDKLSPNLRVYTGESLTAKRAMGDLAETALKFTQHDEGVPTATGGGALETQFRTAQKQMQYAAHTAIADAWIEHRGMEEAGLFTRGATAISDFRGAVPEGKLSFKDFKAAVWDAMDRGDAHAIPEVQKTAQFIRKTIYDPMAKMAEQTIGPDGQPLLSEFREPPNGSQSFVDRIWNKQALIQKRPDAVRRFADYYESEQARHAEVQQIVGSLQRNMEKAAAEEARLTEAAAKKSGPERADLEYDARMQRGAQDRIRKAIEEQLERWGGNTTKDALAAIKKRTLAEEKGGAQVERLTGADSAVDDAVQKILGRTDLDMSREELENLANETVDRILSTPDGRIPYEGDHITSGQGFGGQQVRGSLNERRFAIPSQDVKDLLERDIEHVIAAHIRTVLPDVLLTERFGDIRMTDQIRGILEDYAAKSSKEGISGKEAARLNKLKDRDIADVTAVRDRLRGTYGWTPDPTMRNVGQVIHAFHNYTTITSLGTSALNRLNDWGMQSIFRNGFMNTLGDMWAPMLKGMLQIDKEGTREIVRQARDMGIGVDGMLGHARYNLGDVTDSLRPGNTFTRGLAWAADRSMIVNLHGPETDCARIFNWVAAQAEFGRVAEKIAGGNATKKDFARMADANIDPHMAARIWAQIDEHHNMVGGTRLANTGAWTDEVARAAFERAMNREANINVVQAGIGDKPLFLSRPLGSLVGQFKSFTAGATERILIANLQQGDARTLQGVISGIAMGMLGYRLYTLASGQPVSDRPQDWIKEGIIRSGMGGWLIEGNNTLAKFTSGKSDVFRAIGADRPSSRRASESALSDLLGPTYSHLEGLTQAIGHATYTDPKTGASAFTARDIHNLRQAGILPVPPFVFQNLMGLRRIGDEFEDGIARSLGIKPMNREPRYGPQ
jgi:hypothetical protein